MVAIHCEFARVSSHIKETQIISSEEHVLLINILSFGIYLYETSFLGT